MRISHSGRGAARLAHLHGVQGVGGSNPLAPTEYERKTVLAGDGFVLRRAYGNQQRNFLPTY
jgi:hypothetical protein